MRHFRKRVTLGKVPVKHSSTLVDNTGAGVGSFFGHLVYTVDAGLRSTTGGVQTIQDKANTEEDCRIGDIVKYVNICLECSPRGANPTADNDNAGWLEWAIVWQREKLGAPTTANIGVLTLGCICSHAFRENCFMTGCFPLGTKQAMSSDLRIKIPQRCTRLRMGDTLKIFCYIRTSNSSDVRTDSHRLIASSHFKSYS